MFETDVKILIDAVNAAGDKKGCSTFDTIIDDCRELIKHFQEVLLVFVPISANSVAHLIANDVYSVSDLQEWITTVLIFLFVTLLWKQASTLINASMFISKKKKNRYCPIL